MNLDYGLTGKIALVCGSSAGIGRGCATALAECGATVVLNGRSAGRLEKTANELSASTGSEIKYIMADVSTREGRASLRSACPAPDILVNNAAGPPPGDFRNFSEADWHSALEASMVAPIMMIRQVIDSMREKKWGRIINITSSAVKAPIPLLGLSNGARSGLTGFIAGLAREVAQDGITINNILPGKITTGRLSSYIGALADKRGVNRASVAAELAANIPAKRFGTPEELGSLCAFLASRPPGFITGQNLLVDGGEFPGI